LLTLTLCYPAFCSVVNSAALKLAGITAATKDPDGGVIDREADGSPSGSQCCVLLWSVSFFVLTDLQSSSSAVHRPTCYWV
jgi:hypothetical protein